MPDRDGPKTAAPIPSSLKSNLDRRRFLIGSAIAGFGGAAAAALHDGELGGPAQTFRGAVPWQEGTADAPPGASGTGYIFFTPAEVALVDAAVGRLIPNDPVGPGAVEAGRPVLPRSPIGRAVRPRRPLFPGRPLAQGHARAGLSKPLHARSVLPRGHGGHRQIRRRELQRRVVQQAFDRGSGQSAEGTRSGAVQLDGGVDSKSFFAMLLQNTKEGLFLRSDLRRQQGHGRLEDDRLPGRSLRLQGMGSPPRRARSLPPVGFKGRPGWTES